jgi:nucleoside-diphosphate-sugar epimerase
MRIDGSPRALNHDHPTLRETSVRMIVAITGASGFIGRKLVEHHLRLGDGVRILTRRSSYSFDRRAEVHQADLANGSGVLAAFVDGADIVYHCAGVIADESRMRAVNVEGTARLLRAATGHIGRWVQLSSTGAYGKQQSGEITEDTPVAPADEYEITKTEADSLVERTGAADGLQYSILRPSIVFGPTMNNRSVYQWVSAIKRGLFCFIGPPGASANYIHVDNVVEAMHLCATRPESIGNVYNLSCYATVEDFVGWIAQALDKKPPRVRIAKPLMTAAAHLVGWMPGSPLTPSRVDALSTLCTYPIDRIQRELGYRHCVNLKEGVFEFVRYAEGHAELTR